MKQMLKDFSNLLLVMLCDYVLGEVEHLLLGQAGHVALSNDTVSVTFRLSDGGNGTVRNVSVLLLEASTNRTLGTKRLPMNQSRGTVEFECFHFRHAGDYRFAMASDIVDNDTSVPRRESSAHLRAEWPVFHIDLNRTSGAGENALEVGVFTHQPLCPFAVGRPDISLDVAFSSSPPEPRNNPDLQPFGTRASRRIVLSPAQWVEFDCASGDRGVYVTVALRLQDPDSVITSSGPIDLVSRFGYKLVVVPELTCESAVEVVVVRPPCTQAPGKIAVYKEAPRRTGEKAAWLAEAHLQPRDRRTMFNCTLFDVGKNTYCFELDLANKSPISSREKECMVIQRNIETWSLWQSWTPCSVTCGEGIRERHRICLTSTPAKPGCVGITMEASLCSLEECSTVKPSGSPPLQPGGPQKANNMVTVTGISLCLFIIVVTVLVTLWRKFGRTSKCSPPSRHNSIHSPGFRKNSDEEDICPPGERRESFSDGGEGPPGNPGELGIPLTYRRSLQLASEEDASGSESFQSNAQKIIPPLFSYRLAQQQLKEMKKQGLSETTKVYHVSQSPLTDTAVGATAEAPLDPDGPEEAAAATKFRIRPPFPDRPTGPSGERPVSRLDLALPQVRPPVTPGSQTLLRWPQAKAASGRWGRSEKGYPRNSHFRRAASFHEGRQARPFRERSLSTLTPRQAPAYGCGPQVEGRFRPRSRGPRQGPGKPEGGQGGEPGGEPLSASSKSRPAGLPARKPNLMGERPTGLAAEIEWADPPRTRRGPSPNARSALRKEPLLTVTAPKGTSQRPSPLSPSEARRDKPQGFTSHPGYAFYDNTSFGLSELQPKMLDLPGYFGSNEEDDETTSTLSMEKLVF
ncbi:thrombospondin type-1 domain-containing protein 1 [Tachyglossus aculeatus]|uniref:thrombospondin type-1 domain-containing protein 1 n=1 Tax=Tachyglossus aculeatus TaxID=9261 RepID=UPI0018F404E6|nr:thrombospondin type-1 domain-containing protein 1 [Tachyglossus aculeatus]